MTDKNTSIYAPYFEKNDEPFFMKIGNTTYGIYRDETAHSNRCKQDH